MSDILIKCNSCGSEIKLSESIASDLVEKRLSEEKDKISKFERNRAVKEVSKDLESKAQELKEARKELEDNNKKLTEAQKTQVLALKKQRELEQKERELDLTLEKKLNLSLKEHKEKTSKELQEQYTLKLAEKDEAISSIKKKLEEANRKAEQGSQQMQGEVLELELENLLKQKFPIDNIEAVAKGHKGGDLIQTVYGPQSQACGKILWESKRTKNWSDSWIAKLKDDQRASKIEIAIIVSTALPKTVESFDYVNGVWVTHPRTALPLAISLRAGLIELASFKQANLGQESKLELVYQYLTGPRFRQRVEAIVEAFSNMKSDLDKEKRSINAIWQKREAQIERVMLSTVGMYGDLQAIAGKSLQEIEGLEIDKIE